MSDEEREEISLAEAMQRRKSGDLHLSEIQAHGVVKIIHADGTEDTFEVSTDALNEPSTKEETNET
jgi:hypothetical protein